MNPTRAKLSPLRLTAFTLLELLAAMLILTLLILFGFSAFEQGRRAWAAASQRARAFEDARRALVIIGNDLASACGGGGLKFIGQTDKLSFVAPLSGSENWLTSATTNAWVTNDLVDLCWIGYEFIADPPLGHLVRKCAPPQSRYNTANAPSLLNTIWEDHVYGSAQTGNTNFFQVILSHVVARCQFQFDDGTSLTANWTLTNRLPRAVRIRIETVDEQTARQLRSGGSSALLLTSAVRVVETQVYLRNSR